MTNVIQQAENVLLLDSDVNHSHLESILGQTLGRGIDFADIYLQSSIEEEWFLEDGIVKTAGFTVDRGFGYRVISGEKVGFSYSDNIELASLEKAAKVAKSIVSQGGAQTVNLSTQGKVTNFYRPDSPIASISDAQKVELLQRMDKHARSLDKRIQHVLIRLNSTYDVIWTSDMSGKVAADIRPLVHLTVRVIAKDANRTERGSAGGGARSGLDYFLQEDCALAYVEKAVRQALLNLEAGPSPAGIMPVILGPGWPGVLLHEAVGHGLEADFIRKGSSVFAGRLGEVVASPLCTIVDDATVLQGRGSLSIDDEGTPGQRTVLIEKGVLKGYMADKHNARLMCTQSTGNGRRESYAHLPMPRMTSTYMMPGQSDPEDMIASVDRGLYAVDFSGGQVDITSGKFVFTMSEAYLIENGRVTRPVKGATLVGNGAEVLSKVSMVGHDMALDPGLGFCGKDGQTVPVAVGQPSLKVDAITVGGTVNGG